MSPDSTADDLIEIKFDRKRRWPPTLGTEQCLRTGPDVIRSYRRCLLWLTGTRRIAPDWKSLQITPPAKTANTDTIAAEIRIESTGMALSF